MLLFTLQALAHGTIYATGGIVVSPDGAEVWALAGGWGLIQSTDGGERWTWWCEEGFGSESVYAVETLGTGDIAVGTGAGLWRWTDGALSLYNGLPADAQVGNVRRFGTRLLVDVASSAEADGLYVCTDTGCAPTTLSIDGTYVQSLTVDDRAWVVLRESAALHSRLWRSDDGLSWTQVADWGEGGPTRTVLRATGDDLWIWAQPRDPEANPWLERSRDGGASITVVWESPYGTADLPGLAAIGGGLLLSNSLGYTLRSDDDGATWTDVSDTMPMIRCAADVAGEVWVCTDHFVDGFDIARLDAIDAWTALGCMDDAAPEDEACDPYLADYVAAGAYGGDACDASWAPEPEAPGCGCADNADSAAALLILGWYRRRRVA